MIGKRSDGIGVGGAVGQEGRTVAEAVEQRQRFRAAVILARRQGELDGTTFGIDDGWSSARL